jgi:hypothetical protein
MTVCLGGAVLETLLLTRRWLPCVVDVSCGPAADVAAVILCLW